MNRTRREINRRHKIVSANRRIRRHNLLFSDIELSEDKLNKVADWHEKTNLQKDQSIIQLFDILYTISA